MATQNDWPNPPDQTGDKKADAWLERYKAELLQKTDQDKADYQNDLNIQKAAYDNHFTIHQAVYKGYIDVAKGAIDRSLQRADYVQKVAAAIGTVYAGIVALTYSVGTDKGVSLPITGMIPAIFLGVSFFLSAVYVACLRKKAHSGYIKAELSGPTLRSDQDAIRNTFINWNNQSVLQRSEFLTASVVSLAIGVICLPLPYLSTKIIHFWCALGIGIVMIILTLLIEGHLNNRASQHSNNQNTSPIPLSGKGKSSTSP